jgi:hypothetical protein
VERKEEEEKKAVREGFFAGFSFQQERDAGL